MDITIRTLCIGDRVRIDKDSAFYIGDSDNSNPIDVDGVVTKIVHKVHYQVRWDNGTENWYLLPDLVSIGSILWS
jgi:general stress protein 26